MANKVKYGLKNVYYAVATVDSSNVATYGTPKPWHGAVNLSLDAEGGTTKFRADNIDYWVGQSNNGYSGDFESALIPDDFRKDVLGEVVQSNIQYEKAQASTTPFALLFQFEGDDTATRHVFYNCTAARPNVGSQTTEESIEVQTEEMNLVCGSIYNSVLDANIVKGKCSDSTKDEYTNWFSAVQQATGAVTT